MRNSEQIEILAQLFQNLSENDKMEFLAQINKKSPSMPDYAPLANETKSSFLQAQKRKAGQQIVCISCGSKHVVKNGTSCGTQRYLCKECGKSFGETENTILKSSNKGLEVWRLYVKCMVEKKSIRKCAEICGISVPTSFLWRHKILDALQNMMADVQLNGVVEADETFTAISYKGQRTAKMP